MKEQRNITIITGIETLSLGEKSLDLIRNRYIPIYTFQTLLDMNKTYIKYTDLLNEYVVTEEAIIEMDTSQLRQLDYQQLENNHNIKIKKIIVVEEDPKIVSERLSRKYYINISQEHANLYQQSKLHELLGIIKHLYPNIIELSTYQERKSFQKTKKHI